MKHMHTSIIFYNQKYVMQDTKDRILDVVSLGGVIVPNGQGVLLRCLSVGKQIFYSGQNKGQLL